MAFSPDGKYLAAATKIGLWWYELTTMQPVALWETERGLVSAVSFSDTGSLVATGNADGIVKVWDAQKQQCIVKIGRRVLNNRISQLAFSPDGKYLAASYLHYRGTISVWRAETGMSVAEFTVEKPKAAYGTLQVLCFSPDSALLAYVSSNNVISVSHLETNTSISCLAIDSARVDSLAFSPGGQFLAAGTRKKVSGNRSTKVSVWNVQHETLEMSHEYGGYQAISTYLPTGSLRIADVHEDNVVIWDASRQEKLDTFEHQGHTCAACFSDNGHQFAIASARVFNVWWANTGRIASVSGHRAFANSIVFSQKGRRLIGGHGESSGVVCWNVAKKHVQQTFPGNTEAYHAGRFISLSPCEEFLAISCLKTIEIWHIASGTRIVEFIEGRGVSDVEFSPTGRHFAGSIGKGELHVWDAQRWKKLHALTGDTGRIRSIAFHPDGQRLASTSKDKTACVWDIKHGFLIASLPLAFSLERGLYKGDDQAIEHTLKVWSKAQKSPSKAVWNITFSPCGHLIAGGMEGEIRLWDATTYETYMVILPPQGCKYPYALAFSPCGRYLASGSWWLPGHDKVSIRLWDVTTGENVHTFWGHPTDVQCLAFSPDGAILASGSFDGTILLWDTTSYL